MFRALVLLLILPQMLMPPGTCICQFVSIGEASGSIPASTSPQPSPGRATGHRLDSPCDACHCSQSAALPERCDDQPSHAPDDGPSSPVPGKHWPGCPAVFGVAPFNMAVPTVEVQADFVATSGFCAPIAETVVPLDRAAPVSPSFGSPPLFISHCSLLI